MAIPLSPAKIQVAYLNSTTPHALTARAQNSSISCKELKFVQFWFLAKFGCHGNSLGSLEIIDIIYEVADADNLTVCAKNSSISCTELTSVQL